MLNSKKGQAINLGWELLQHTRFEEARSRLRKGWGAPEESEDIGGWDREDEEAAHTAAQAKGRVHPWPDQQEGFQLLWRGNRWQKSRHESKLSGTLEATALQFLLPMEERLEAMLLQRHLRKVLPCCIRYRHIYNNRLSSSFEKKFSSCITRDYCWRLLSICIVFYWSFHFTSFQPGFARQRAINWGI